jgi:hypothetical protein
MKTKQVTTIQWKFETDPDNRRHEYKDGQILCRALDGTTCLLDKLTIVSSPPWSHENPRSGQIFMSAVDRFGIHRVFFDGPTISKAIRKPVPSDKMETPIGVFDLNVGENFVDGALRIGWHILEQIEAELRVPTAFYGTWMKGHFTINQHTYCWWRGEWVAIEDQKRNQYGL